MYLDNKIIVCVKPAGVLSTDEPGGMPSLLRAALGDDTAPVYTVHRLDAAVSGVMV
ncbi:RluA family pseudouridine synthase, partial [bacterium]|nr:RluA family pseudouridine synthase [bacterium]